MNETSGPDTSGAQASISVFLLDDHEIVGRGVRELLTAEPDIDVIGEAGTAASAPASGKPERLTSCGGLCGTVPAVAARPVRVG
jgi:hypothetical protein